MPWVIAGSSYGKNPIVQSFFRNAPVCEDLDPGQLRATSVNEPLINWHSADGDHALEAIRVTQGWADNASDKRMSFHSRLLREKEGMHVLPASTAGLIAMLNRHRTNALPPDRYVAILTGRRE